MKEKCILQESMGDLGFAVVRIDEVHALLNCALWTDGAHHKQWYLEKFGKLCGFDIEQWRLDLKDKNVWKKGIAP